MEIDEEPMDTLSIARSAERMISVLQRDTASSLRTLVFLNSLLAAKLSKRGRSDCNPGIAGGVPVTCHPFLIGGQVDGRKIHAGLTRKSIRPQSQSKTAERGSRYAGEAVAQI